MSTGPAALGSLLNPDRRVETGEVSLQPVGRGGITGSVPKEQARHAGVDVDDPGTRQWFYLRSQQLLIIDLGEQFAGDE
jgi:hypothetical protein